MTPVTIFLLQALVALALPVAAWRLLGLRQIVPLAVVQIMAGIALGPSLLGRLAPGLTGPLTTPQALAPLSGIATLAVILFSFLTGLHLDPRRLASRGPGFLAVAAGSAFVPALLGAAAGLFLATLHPELMGPHATPLRFAAAIGICAGITALPVLGAILLQMGMMGHRLGQLALACAAFNDAVLWTLMAILLAFSGGERSFWPALLGGPLLVLFMLGVARPLLERLLARRDGEALGELALVAACTAALGSAAITEALGLNHVLGAFVAGLAVPMAARRGIVERLEAPVATALLPFFFVLTGLRTRIEMGSAAFLLVFVLATAASTLGKVGGTALLARWTGEGWRTAFGLGSLLQTKGLMEVVVLTVLLDAGLIAPAAFSALVLMALAATAATMPLTRLALGPQAGEPDSPAPEPLANPSRSR